MTDGGSHFIHGTFRNYLLNMMSIIQLHPPITLNTGQVELSNREIKLILQKMSIGPERIGPRNLMMHFGPIE